MGNTDTGYLINAEGMICGLSGDKEVIKDGVLYFPEEGCSGIARGALSGLGSAVEEIEIPANITNIQPGAFVGLSNLGWDRSRCSKSSLCYDRWCTLHGRWHSSSCISGSVDRNLSGAGKCEKFCGKCI